MNPRFKQITKLFQKLPGVGPRQAARFVLALIDKDESELKELGQAISNLKKEIHTCRECFNISDNSHCHICSDSKRDQAKLMIVEKATDLDPIEKTGMYRGLYHVLGGAINPLDKITPESLRFRELGSRVEKLVNRQPIELIIATNPTTAGETTALYIRELFKNKSNIIITRLGRGLASGSNLEYTDELTIKNALQYRQ